LKYCENQPRSGCAANTSNMSVVPLRGIPTKKIGLSTEVGRVPWGLRERAGLMSNTGRLGA
jgi:hypothetical protein